MARRLFLFDLMDTVVEDPFFRTVPRALGLPLDRILAYKDPKAWLRFEAGEIDERGWHHEFFRPDVSDPPFTREDFARAMQSDYRFLPGMEDLLRELAAAGIPLAIASNYPPWIDLVRRRLDLDRFFRRFFVSCELRVRKPDPRFFERILEATALPPAEATFVDDREPNVAAAAALGIESIRFEGAEALRRRLGL